MKNYIVWSPERGLPTKTHAGIDAATAEASCLAAKHPGVPFHVYALLGTACASVSIAFQSATTPEVPRVPPLLSDSDPVPSEKPEGWIELGPDEVIQKHDLLWAPKGRYRAWANGYVGRSAVAWRTNPNEPVLRHPSRHKTATPEKPAADEVARGHNPLGLTNAEVGVSEGWRLLEDAELWTRDHVGSDGVEFFQPGGRKWTDEFFYIMAHARYEWSFRTKNPPGFYLRGREAADYVPEGLPAGSSAGEGFRFLRPSELVRADDETNSHFNFGPSDLDGGAGWLSALVVFDGAVGRRAETDTRRVYRRKSGT